MYIAEIFQIQADKNAVIYKAGPARNGAYDKQFLRKSIYNIGVEIRSLSDKKLYTTTCPIRILSLSRHCISLSNNSIYMGERGILSGIFRCTKTGFNSHIR